MHKLYKQIVLLLDFAILMTVLFFLGFIVVGGAHLINAIKGVL